MSKAAWCRALCFPNLLLLVVVNLSYAQAPETHAPESHAPATRSAEEVAFPKLPTGAGEIAKDAPKQFTQSASGLRYRILREGKGQKPKETDTVNVNYHGWLDGGKVF